MSGAPASQADALNETALCQGRSGMDHVGTGPKTRSEGTGQRTTKRASPPPPPSQKRLAAQAQFGSSALPAVPSEANSSVWHQRRLIGHGSKCRGWTKSISHHFEAIEKALFVGFCGGIIRNQFFLGGAGFRPSTVGASHTHTHTHSYVSPLDASNWALNCSALIPWPW